MNTQIRMIARQGDIGFIKVDSIPSTATAKKQEHGRLIMAYGEVTGHHHSVIDNGGCALLTDPNNADNSYLLVDVDVAHVEHQEHATINLPRGKYHVVRQVEWSDENEPIAVTD